jgi:hypothetical protein
MGWRCRYFLVLSAGEPFKEPAGKDGDAKVH